MTTNVDALLRTGGTDALERAATLVSEADWMSIVPDGDDLPEKVWAKLRAAAHPLGWLRSRITPLERGVSTTPHVREAQVASTSSGAAAFDRVEINVPGSIVAFGSMCERSNGRACSVAVRLAETAPISSETIHAVARHLHPHQRFSGLASVGAESAVSSLVETGMCGGAYDQGPGAALGRMYAWRTLCWLMSRQAEMTMSDAVKAASSRQWFSFDHDDRWILSGAVGCYHLEARRLALVAWCDVD